ncbi:MAG: hypothetical protein ACYTEQ_27030 [Planctomycetota bacterium]|jgi:hypothetical protein
MARARNRKKKALYEVIGQGQLKGGSGKAEEQLRPEGPVEAEPAAPTAEATAPSAEAKPIRAAPRWPTKPRLVQVNTGRIEISIPYQLGIAVLLGVLLLVLVVFRLGQLSYAGGEKAAGTKPNTAKAPAKKRRPVSRVETRPRQRPPERTAPVEAAGSNRVVIQTFQVPSQLQPVKEYFAGFGIETEIKKVGDWYYLVTRDKYDNPERPGTDGYRAKQRIIDLGADYKAPPGYERFGTRPFHDAYGMKFDD